MKNKWDDLAEIIASNDNDIEEKEKKPIRDNVCESGIVEVNLIFNMRQLW